MTILFDKVKVKNIDSEADWCSDTAYLSLVDSFRVRF